jgi:hypothetical protein
VARAANSPAHELLALIHHHYAYTVDKIQDVRWKSKWNCIGRLNALYGKVIDLWL